MKVGKLLAKAAPGTHYYLYENRTLMYSGYLHMILDEEKELEVDDYYISEGGICINLKTDKDRKIKKIKKMIDVGIANGCILVNDSYVCLNEEIVSVGYCDESFYVFFDSLNHEIDETLFSIEFNDIKKITAGEVTKHFD